MFELGVYLRDRLIGRTTFQADEVRIGRGADNELQIDNLALSRYHASVEVVEGFHVLKDFGSQNGTFVNGEKVVGRKVLQDGDRIGFGKFIVVFRCDQKPPEAKEPARITNEAAYAVAGETLVSKTDTRERTCPHTGYLSPITEEHTKPVVHALTRDVVAVGSAPGSDVPLAVGPSRAALVLRGWRGFSLVALGPTKRNGESIEFRSDLSDGDALDFGGQRYVFHTGASEAGA
jgi:predicted component of type VI protein secretion system